MFLEIKANRTLRRTLPMLLSGPARALLKKRPQTPRERVLQRVLLTSLLPRKPQTPRRGMLQSSLLHKKAVQRQEIKTCRSST